MTSAYDGTKVAQVFVFVSDREGRTHTAVSGDPIVADRALSLIRQISQRSDHWMTLDYFDQMLQDYSTAAVTRVFNTLAREGSRYGVYPGLVQEDSGECSISLATLRQMLESGKIQHVRLVGTQALEMISKLVARASNDLLPRKEGRED